MNSVFEFGFEQGAKLTLTDPTELGTLLSDAGFVDVSVTSETRQFAFAALDAYWENARSTGVRAVIDRLGVAEADQVRAKLAARLAAYQAGSSYLVPATALLATARR